MTNQPSSDEPFDISKAVPPKTIARAPTIKRDADFTEVTIETKVSCTIDVAVAKMLGWLRGPTALVNILISEHGITEENLIALDTLVYPIEDHLLELLTKAKDKAYEAFDDASTIEEVKDKSIEVLEKCEAQINRARFYKLSIDEELSKGNKSELTIDVPETESSGKTYIKLMSLDRWARKNYDISILEATRGFTSNNAERPTSVALTEGSQTSHKQPSSDTCPWLIPDSRDPEAVHPWYIPARYFARKLVKDDTTLLSKPKILAQKVSESLTKVSIYKRGGKLPLDPSTIRKAFSNIKFG